MVDPVTSRRWAFRILYVLVMVAIMFARIVPISTEPGGIPGPDLMALFTVAWVLRRPDFVPPVLIGLVFLFADFMFMRPPGLMAALMVMATEFLRRREANSRDLPFLLEWAMVAGVLFAVTIGYRLILVVLFVERAGFGLTMLQQVVTLLSYPVVVLASRLAFGLRKTAPGQVDSLGHRL